MAENHDKMVEYVCKAEMFYYNNRVIQSLKETKIATLNRFPLMTMLMSKNKKVFDETFDYFEHSYNEVTQTIEALFAIGTEDAMAELTEQSAKPVSLRDPRQAFITAMAQKVLR